jgi:chromosome segregation ATPase
MSAEALAQQVSVLKENLVDVEARLQQHTEAARSASVALAKVTSERQQLRQEAASVQAEVAALECQASDWTVLAKRRGSERASLSADSSLSLADTLKVRRFYATVPQIEAPVDKSLLLYHSPVCLHAHLSYTASPL